MKAWAEKRRRELEASGEAELARMFALVVRMCEVDEVNPCSETARISEDIDTSEPI